MRQSYVLSLAAEGPSLASPPAERLRSLVVRGHPGQLHGASQLWINCDGGAIGIRRYRLFTWRI